MHKKNHLKIKEMSEAELKSLEAAFEKKIADDVRIET